MRPSGGQRGFFRVNYIGRFREQDVTNEPTVSPDGPSPEPAIEGNPDFTGR